MRYDYLILLSLIFLILTAGCMGASASSSANAAVDEMRAAIEAQNRGLENLDAFDLEYVGGDFVVTDTIPARIDYAHEQFAESLTHAKRAQEHLDAAGVSATSTEEVLKYGRYLEAALLIEDVSAYGLNLTAELRNPSPNGSACIVYSGVIDGLLGDQHQALVRADL